MIFFTYFPLFWAVIECFNVDLQTEYYDSYSLATIPTRTLATTTSQSAFSTRSLSLSLSQDRIRQDDDPIFTSPSNGTNILKRPIQLIRCINQTHCIEPKLQLIKQYSVYYCK